ncbi:hypothetical protein BSKO_08080 [Bryopsis sp. KO-2023]|nr:hypothetical protein BSKO_08080 [Bryopsis sp. KO-2023]
MEGARREISTPCLKALFLDRVKDIEHNDPVTVQIICSGYDIVTGGWGDNMISRVSDGAHWALAALDAKKFSAAELHNQYKLMTPGTLLKVKSYEIRQYKHGKLCLLMRDFAFLEKNNGSERAIQGAENLIPVSYQGTGWALPEVDVAPIRLPRIPFLYGESRSFQSVAAGLPVLDVNLMEEDFPRSPRTKIPDSQNLNNIRAPPEQARQGEFYSDVWGLTCIEYLNIFKCLKANPALSMSMGSLSNWECNRMGTVELKAFCNMEKQSRNDVRKKTEEIPATTSPDFFPTANNRIRQQCLERAAVLKSKNLAGSSKKEKEAKAMSTEERNALFFEKLKARLETRIESGAGALMIDAGMGGHRHKRSLKGDDRAPSSLHQTETALMSGEWRSPLRSAESGFNHSRSQLRPSSSTYSERFTYSPRPVPMGKENYYNSFQHKVPSAQSYSSLGSHFALPPPQVTPGRHSGVGVRNQDWGFDQGYVNVNSHEWQVDDFPMTPNAHYNPQGIPMVSPLVDQSPISRMPPLGGHFSKIQEMLPAGSLSYQLDCPTSNHNQSCIDGDCLYQEDATADFWERAEMGNVMERVCSDQKDSWGDGHGYNGNQKRTGLWGRGGGRGGRHGLTRLYSC